MSRVRQIEMVNNEGGAAEARDSDDSSDGDVNNQIPEEDKFAQHVDEAKAELKKQVIGMFIFSMIFTLAICGLFYGLIESKDSTKAKSD